jgi:hypothetical protein
MNTNELVNIDLSLVAFLIVRRYEERKEREKERKK